jgi:hypothetical protein
VQSIPLHTALRLALEERDGARTLLATEVKYSLLKRWHGRVRVMAAMHCTAKARENAGAAGTPPPHLPARLRVPASPTPPPTPARHSPPRTHARRARVRMGARTRQAGEAQTQRSCSRKTYGALARGAAGHRHVGHRSHICTGPGLTAATSAPGLGWARTVQRPRSDAGEHACS